jgi:hypothetical protein
MCVCMYVCVCVCVSGFSMQRQVPIMFGRAGTCLRKFSELLKEVQSFRDILVYAMETTVFNPIRDFKSLHIRHVKEFSKAVQKVHVRPEHMLQWRYGCSMCLIFCHLCVCCFVLVSWGRSTSRPFPGI